MNVDVDPQINPEITFTFTLLYLILNIFVFPMVLDNWKIKINFKKIFNMCASNEHGNLFTESTVNESGRENVHSHRYLNIFKVRG